MKSKAWAGLITNASPYAIPLGAATVQVNMTTAIPGQLTCRGGMLPVLFAEDTPALVDVYPYERDGVTRIVGLTESGELVELSSPAYGTSQTPVEPQLAVLEGQVSTSYTRRYITGMFGAVTDPVPTVPDDGPLTNVLDGNPDSQYSVDAEAQCDPDSLDAVDGGLAGTAIFNPVVAVSTLCDP